jgi:hypothetical protein
MDGESSTVSINLAIGASPLNSAALQSQGSILLKFRLERWSGFT